MSISLWSHAILSILLIANPWGTALADSAQNRCANVRLDEPGGSMARVPVFNQGLFPTCYIFTAAQMADAWRFSRGPQPPEGGYDFVTSPVILAKQYLGDDLSVAPARIGFTDNSELVGNYLRTHGACSHHHVFGNGRSSYLPERWLQIENDLADFFRRHAANVGNNRAMQRLILEDITRLHPEWDAFRRVASLEATLALRSGEATRACHSLISSGFSETTLIESLGEDVASALARMMGQSLHSAQEFIANFERQACRGHTLNLSWIPPYQSRRTANPSFILSNLHRRLSEASPQPIGITFCSGLIGNPSHRGLNAIGAQCSNSDNHNALVIGRRWNTTTRSCQLLIRNSWGRQCGDVLAHNPHWDCEEGSGQIWIDEEAVAANTYFMHWIGE